MKPRKNPTKYEQVHVLNAVVDNISMDELVNDFNEGLLLTLHVDMIMKLQADKDFYDILPEFDIITCDSQILYFATKFLGKSVKERVSGSDYFPKYYMHHKDNKDVTIFLCGGGTGIADIAKDNINKKVGRDIVVGTYSPPFDFDKSETEIERMISAINDSGATVLLVGLGGGRQEKFIVKYRDRFDNVKTFLPLGGTIDYEAATFKRPPSWITEWGFEWLYRLLKEPKQRFHRYVIHEPPVLYHLLAQKLGFYKDPFANEKAG